MNAAEYLIPTLIALLLLLCLAKRINAYECFTEGASEAIKLCVSVFPYVCAIFITVYLFRASGMAQAFTRLLSPVLGAVGVPSELSEIILIKPLSGGGSLAVLEDVYNTYGADSYVSRCASVIMNSSDTVFYIAAVYFSSTKVKRLRGAVSISLIATLFGAVFACLLCRIM